MTTRQNGERIVHFDPGAGVVCWITGTAGTSDPRATTCQHCLNTPVWKKAWREEPRRVSAP